MMKTYRRFNHGKLSIYIGWFPIVQPKIISVGVYERKCDGNIRLFELWVWKLGITIWWRDACNLKKEN